MFKMVNLNLIVTNCTVQKTYVKFYFSAVYSFSDTDFMNNALKVDLRRHRRSDFVFQFSMIFFQTAYLMACFVLIFVF